MRYVTVSEMKEIDRAAIEKYGVSALKLMENAGKAVAAEAAKIIPRGDVAVFCGFGNNGGDGLVAARHLANRGYGVSVFFVGRPRALSKETNANLEALFAVKVNPEFVSKKEDIGKIFDKIRPNAVIDAVFGIGLKGPTDEFYNELFRRINSIGVPVISADVPSGLDADTGMPLGTAVKSAVTVTFGYPKTGFRNLGSAPLLGRIVVADIGLPTELMPASAHPANKGVKAIKLRGGKTGIIRPGHPWIYSRQLLKTDPAIKPGDIISVIDQNGKFLGKGYYNPHSDISIRMMTDKDAAIDADFFKARFEAAVGKRKELNGKTNAYRAVFSESDGLPGLIVDIYDTTAVFQVLTLGMERLKDLAISAIKDVLKPAYIYEKSVSQFRKMEGMENIASWHGAPGAEMVEIFESDVKFLVDIISGHKTGFYLDQRKARFSIRTLVRDKSVLDAFCYTGGFGVSAALSGAANVTGVDIKDHWLELGGKNAALNGVSGKMEFIKSDAFDYLEEAVSSGRKFDVIIVDPPSFLRNRESLVTAIKGYEELNTNAMKVLSDGGVLATFSCSHNMPANVFANIIKNSAKAADKNYTILKRCHQDIDHPIVRAIPETEYLKGYFLRISS